MSGCEHNSKITKDCATCVSLRADMEAFWKKRERFTSDYRQDAKWQDLSRVGEAHEGLTSHKVWYDHCYDAGGCHVRK